MRSVVVVLRSCVTSASPCLVSVASVLRRLRSRGAHECCGVVRCGLLRACRFLRAERCTQSGAPSGCVRAWPVSPRSVGAARPSVARGSPDRCRRRAPASGKARWFGSAATPWSRLSCGLAVLRGARACPTASSSGTPSRTVSATTGSLRRCSSQAAGGQGPREGQPAGDVLIRADLEAEDFAAVVGVDPDRDQGMDVDPAAVFTDLGDQGVDPDERVWPGVQRPLAQRFDLSVEVAGPSQGLPIHAARATGWQRSGSVLRPPQVSPS